MSELESVKTEEELRLDETETLEKVKTRFEGKDFSDSLQRLIVESRRLYLSTGQKVTELITRALTEGFKKEDAKEIVAIIMGISRRTVERYFPEHLKELKYERHDLQEARSKKQQVEDETEEGEKTPDQLIYFYRQIMKQVQKKQKFQSDITINGRTFPVTIDVKVSINEANEDEPVRFDVALDYNEKAIIKILQS